MSKKSLSGCAAGYCLVSGQRRQRVWSFEGSSKRSAIQVRNILLIFSPILQISVLWDGLYEMDFSICSKQHRQGSFEEVCVFFQANLFQRSQIISCHALPWNDSNGWNPKTPPWPNWHVWKGMLLCPHSWVSCCFLSAGKTFTGQQNVFAEVAYKFTEWVIQVTNTDSVWAWLFCKCGSWSKKKKKEFRLAQWNDYRSRNTNCFFSNYVFLCTTFRVVETLPFKVWDGQHCRAAQLHL